MPIDISKFPEIIKLYQCSKEIKEAFDKTFLRKLKIDGYCDLSNFIIDRRITKTEMLVKLQAINSRFDVLYSDSHPYPKKNDINVFWRKYVEEKDNRNYNISNLEAIAIVNWIYKLLKKEERIEFTKYFLNIIEKSSEQKKFFSDIDYIDGVFYDSENIEIKHVDSFDGFNNTISKINAEISKNDPNTKLFFRGHSNINYVLKPSLLRNQKWKSNEQKMYNELIIECPYDFEKCTSHLEKLVLMQHYGLPTRLLDITRNPLVALFFAAETDFGSNGEVIIISAEEEKIKYPQSDTVSILASLPLLDESEQNNIRKAAADKTSTKEQFHEKIKRLLHAIKLEKPAFLSEINKKDITDSFIVNALKNNNRIIKQDGAFILCGLLKDKENLNSFRYKQKDGKRIVLLIKNKEKIKDELASCSINHTTLFPEIECVSEYIKSKYLTQ